MSKKRDVCDESTHVSDREPETNTQLVTRLMEEGPVGALSQLIVLHALGHYTREVLADRETVLKRMEGGWISGPGWVKGVEWIKGELDKHLNKPN